MAITQTTVTDKIEVVGPWRSVQVRVVVVFSDDGAEIGRGDYHRHIVECQQPDGSGGWEDTDVSGEHDEVRQICESGIWTEANKASYRESHDA